MLWYLSLSETVPMWLNRCWGYQCLCIFSPVSLAKQKRLVDVRKSNYSWTTAWYIPMVREDIDGIRLLKEIREAYPPHLVCYRRNTWGPCTARVHWWYCSPSALKYGVHLQYHPKQLLVEYITKPYSTGFSNIILAYNFTIHSAL